jgi:hypothetical protein
VARALFATGLALIVTFFLHPGLEPLLAATLWLPLLATLAFLLRSERDGARPCPWAAGLPAVVAEGASAAAAFLAVTLAWLVPLAAALGPGAVPYGLFFGQVKQGALTLPLEPPPRAARELALVAIWLPLGLAALEPARDRPGRATFGAALAVSLLIPMIPVRQELWELSDNPAFYPWLTTLHVDYGSLYL